MAFSFEDIVKSCAYRKLRTLYNYRQPTKQVLAKAVSHELGELIGVYENNHEIMFIHTHGLAFSAHYPLVRYQDIASVETPRKQKKMEIDTIVIILNSGEAINLKIDGRQGRLADVWGIYTFIQRIPYLVKKYKIQNFFL